MKAENPLFDIVPSKLNLLLMKSVPTTAVKIPDSLWIYPDKTQKRRDLSVYNIVDAKVEAAKVLMTLRHTRTGHIFEKVPGWMAMQENGTLPACRKRKRLDAHSAYTAGRQRNRELCRHLPTSATRAVVFDGSMANTGRMLREKGVKLVMQVNYDLRANFAHAALGFPSFNPRPMLSHVAGLSVAQKKDGWHLLHQILFEPLSGVKQSAIPLIADVSRTVYALDGYSCWNPAPNQEVLDKLCRLGAPLLLLTYCVRGSSLHPSVPRSHKVVFRGRRASMRWIILKRRTNRTRRELRIPGSWWKNCQEHERKMTFLCTLLPDNRRVRCLADSRVYPVSRSCIKLFSL